MVRDGHPSPLVIFKDLGKRGRWFNCNFSLLLRGRKQIKKQYSTLAIWLGCPRGSAGFKKEIVFPLAAPGGKE
jgi:hypothetical protein